MSLRVPLEALCINADGGAHPSAAATHSKHKAGRIIEDDPQTLKLEKDNVFMISFTVSPLFFYLFRPPLRNTHCTRPRTNCDSLYNRGKHLPYAKIGL